MDLKNNFKIYDGMFEVKETLIDLKYDIMIMKEVSKLRFITVEDLQECERHVEDVMKKVNKMIEYYYEV